MMDEEEIRQLDDVSLIQQYENTRKELREILQVYIPSMRCGKSLYTYRKYELEKQKHNLYKELRKRGLLKLLASLRNT